MNMAGPCFWREPLNLVQDCGDEPSPGDWSLTFNNGYMNGDEEFFLLAPGFEVGTDFLLKIEGDEDGRTLEMRYFVETDRYVPYYMGEPAYYYGPDGAAAVATQGANSWDVVVYVLWS